MRRAGIYTRISVKASTEGPVAKVDAQESMCRALCENKYDVVRVYTDDGISASTFKDRPGWSDLLADIEAGELDVVVAVSEDRFSRQPMEKEALTLGCAAAGVTWHTVNDGVVDPATADGEFFSGFRGLLGRFEASKMSKRKRDMNNERRALGVIPKNGPRPWGWQPDRVHLDPTESALLREAFDAILAGATVSSVCTDWNARGIPTSMGGRWNIPKLQTVLKRPRNCGWVTFKGQRVLDREGKPVPGTWEPVVSEETYVAVLAILENPARRLTKAHTPKRLGSSLATCGTCGSPMRSAINHGRPMYRCATAEGYGERKPGERHVSVFATDLDDVLTEAAVSAVLFAPTSGVTDADTETLRGLHVRLSDVRKAQARLLELVEADVFSVAEIAVKKSAFTDEATDLETRIAAIAEGNARAALMMEAQAELWSGGKVSIADAAKVKGQIRERFAALPLTDQRALVRGLVRVTVNGQHAPERYTVEHLVADLNEEPVPA